MSTLTQQRSLLLVDGYFRGIIKGINQLNIPKEMKQMIFIFYFKSIEDEMIFDTEVMNDITNKNKCMFHVINDHKIKMVDTNKHLGVAAKLKYGISVNSNEYQHLKSISWDIKIKATKSFPNAYYFIGVVSNRCSVFSTCPFVVTRGTLKDAYGISGNVCSIFHPKRKKTQDTLVRDTKYLGFEQRRWITVRYIIKHSTLIYQFHDGDGYAYNNSNISYIYELSLPTYNIDGITHWYPCVSLRDAGDECEIGQVTVA